MSMVSVRGVETLPAASATSVTSVWDPSPLTSTVELSGPLLATPSSVQSTPWTLEVASVPWTVTWTVALCQPL
jgi:hypothetical protein